MDGGCWLKIKKKSIQNDLSSSDVVKLPEFPQHWKAQKIPSCFNNRHVYNYIISSCILSKNHENGEGSGEDDR